MGQQLAREAETDQVPRAEEMLCKTVALARLACPDTNIPSTTALATLNRTSGRELGPRRGANSVMPNLTPTKYRALYEVYPNKVCIDETAIACGMCPRSRIHGIGRIVGSRQGGRRRRAV